MREGLRMDKIMGFYSSPHLMFSIMFVSVRYFHNQLCIYKTPKILKEMFAIRKNTNLEHIIGSTSMNYDHLGL